MGLGQMGVRLARVLVRGRVSPCHGARRRRVRLRCVFVLLRGFRMGVFRHVSFLGGSLSRAGRRSRSPSDSVAFRFDPLGRIDRRGLVKGAPAVLPVRGFAGNRIHGLVASEDVRTLQRRRRRPGRPRARRRRDTLRVNLSFPPLIDARIGHRHFNPACGGTEHSASDGADSGGNQPAARRARRESPSCRARQEPARRRQCRTHSPHPHQAGAALL